MTSNMQEQHFQHFEGTGNRINNPIIRAFVGINVVLGSAIGGVGLGIYFSNSIQGEQESALHNVSQVIDYYQKTDKVDMLAGVVAGTALAALALIARPSSQS